MDESDEPLQTLRCDIDVEIKEMMGLFDTPAFARRGVELDEMLRRMHERCRVARSDRLDMVRLRLRQWAQAVTGMDSWSDVFAASIDRLWALSDADPPR